MISFTTLLFILSVSSLLQFGLCKLGKEQTNEHKERRLAYRCTNVGHFCLDFVGLDKRPDDAMDETNPASFKTRGEELYTKVMQMAIGRKRKTDSNLREIFQNLNEEEIGNLHSASTAVRAILRCFEKFNKCVETQVKQ